jgi:hypothetical protein
MGNTISKAGTAISDAAQPQYSNQAQVGQSGQTVGDLRKLGYSDADIDAMGGKRTTPSDLQQGLGQGLQQGSQTLNRQPRQGGGQQQMTVNNPQGPVPMSNTDYLTAAMQKWNPKAFMGGGS